MTTKDKCPRCGKIVEIVGYGEKKCPKCHKEIFIIPDEGEKGIVHLVVDLNAWGVPVQGDVFIDAQYIAQYILETLSSAPALEKLSPLLGNILQSLFLKK